MTNMHRLAPVFLVSLVVGCATPVEDVRKEPVRITTTVPAAWDRAGTCLASAYNQFETVYLPVASEQRAEIIVSTVTAGLLGSIKRTMFVFDVQGGSVTTVTWRRDQHMAGSFETEARERIERCGRA